MKILSFGAGMQSTALALMSCDNAIAQTLGRPVPFPKVPVYDAVITKKVKYGFTGLYAFAGSNDYYNKKAYIFIALAPIVLWGLVIAIINPFVPLEWFWVVYSLQIINMSGAAGDLFVTIKFSGFPKDILIRDYGVGMTVFSKE